MLKTYIKSGIRTIQLRSFNENSYYEKLAGVLAENPGLTSDRLSALLKVNVLVMKEQIKQAEMLGYICVDESNEGVRYHTNLIMSYPI